MPIQQPFPTLDQPLIDSETGTLSLIWSRFFLALWNRTGAAKGNDSASFPFPADAGGSGQVLTSQGTGSPSIWTTLRTKLSQFANDSGFITSAALTDFNTSAETQTQIQSFFTGNLSNGAPLSDGTVAQPGRSLQASRSDHIHPREQTPRYTSIGVNGVTWTAGAGAPASPQPNGSIYSRVDGTNGNRLYVSNGTTWLPVAGV